MDISQNDGSAGENRTVEIVRCRELHYSCGCSTTQIERRRSGDGGQPGCQGHGGVLLKSVETIEYRDPKDVLALSASNLNSQG